MGCVYPPPSGERVMTLIKSTDGSGWVEARVKDKVCFHPSEPLVIAKIDGSVIHFEYGERTHVPELLQLIERPIQDGSVVQGFSDTEGKWLDETIEVTPVFMTLWAMHPHLKFRHSSPLIRPVGDV